MKREIVLLTALCLTGALWAQEAAETPPEPPNALGRVFAVRTAKSTRRTIAETLVKTGSISSPAIVEFAPRVSGRLESTSTESGELLEEGSRVRKGQLIATLDDRPYRAARDAARAHLESAKAQLVDAEREYARTAGLVEDRTAAEQELDQAGTARATARAAEQAAAAELEAAEIDLEDTRLLSPMDGVITAKHLYPGAMVPASSVIYTIQQINPLRILLDVPTTVYPLLKSGETRVSVVIDAYPGAPVDLKIDEVYPTASTTTRTVTIRCDLPNPDGLYAPGMFVTGSIALNERENVLVVPYDAVLRTIDRYYVYQVVDGERVVLTPVTVGTRFDDVMEIVSGLEEGVEVVTEGLHRLANGARVRVLDAR